MHRLRFTIPVVLAALFVLTCTASAQTPTGRVKGVVTDDSGGVMPGVTVTATLTDGTTEVATAVTDSVGAYLFEALPAGNLRLTFQLDGFSTVSVPVRIQEGIEQSLAQRLLVAQLKETVTVVAVAPAEPIKRRPPPPPPPPPVVVPVVQHDRDSVCGPAKPDATSVSF